MTIGLLKSSIDSRYDIVPHPFLDKLNALLRGKKGPELKSHQCVYTNCNVFFINTSHLFSFNWSNTNETKLTKLCVKIYTKFHITIHMTMSDNI